MAEHEHKPYDPLTSERPPRRRNNGVVAGIGLSLVIYTAIGWYVYTVRFETKFQEFADQATKVNSAEAASAASAATSATPAAKGGAAPPPKVQPPPLAPRPSLPPPIGITAPPPLALPPPTPPAPPPPAPPPARPPVFTNAILSKPDVDDMAQYFPDRASRNNIDGRATFHCTVTVTGKLTNCTIVSETPQDMGFGASTLQVMRFFKLKPMTRDGVPVESEFTNTIVWQNPKD